MALEEEGAFDHCEDDSDTDEEEANRYETNNAEPKRLFRIDGARSGTLFDQTRSNLMLASRKARAKCLSTLYRLEPCRFNGKQENSDCSPFDQSS